MAARASRVVVVVVVVVNMVLCPLILLLVHVDSYLMVKRAWYL